MALTMLGFEGNFLVSSQLYFHGYEHDPYRLQNQASSLITGINRLMTENIILHTVKFIGRYLS
ncbi:hypothetical protein, partial [Candidatus Fukatsuia symbiotica]|uniref:hypothetical protein n=1 Tax=Candidatus Fukatsuia symbiotica TaxID=1878942 RepID=UPI0013C4A8B7